MQADKAMTVNWFQAVFLKKEGKKKRNLLGQ